MDITALNNDYEARKVATTMEQQAVDVETARKRLPDWLKLEPGFMFRYDADTAMVLGCGGYRSVDSNLRLEMKPSGVLFTYRYKGEWHIADLLTIEDASIDCFRPYKQE